MTDKQKEKWRGRLIQSLERNSRQWRFNGKSFDTEFKLWINHVCYEIRLIRGFGELKAEIFPSVLSGERIPREWHLRESRFEGAECFSLALAWLAEQILQFYEKVEGKAPLYCRKCDVWDSVSGRIEQLFAAAK